MAGTFYRQKRRRHRLAVFDLCLYSSVGLWALAAGGNSLFAAFFFACGIYLYRRQTKPVVRGWDNFEAAKDRQKAKYPHL